MKQVGTNGGTYDRPTLIDSLAAKIHGYSLRTWLKGIAFIVMAAIQIGRYVLPAVQRDSHRLREQPLRDSRVRFRCFDSRILLVRTEVRSMTNSGENTN